MSTIYRRLCFHCLLPGHVKSNCPEKQQLEAKSLEFTEEFECDLRTSFDFGAPRKHEYFLASYDEEMTSSIMGKFTYDELVGNCNYAFKCGT